MVEVMFHLVLSGSWTATWNTSELVFQSPLLPLKILEDWRIVRLQWCFLFSLFCLPDLTKQDHLAEYSLAIFYVDEYLTDANDPRLLQQLFLAA